MRRPGDAGALGATDIGVLARPLDDTRRSWRPKPTAKGPHSNPISSSLLTHSARSYWIGLWRPHSLIRRWLLLKMRTR